MQCQNFGVVWPVERHIWIQAGAKLNVFVFIKYCGKLSKIKSGKLGLLFKFSLG